jgi:hypothetical protein
MADSHLEVSPQPSPSRVTLITPVRDIIVGLIFLASALVRFLPPFNSSVPSVGLLWISFIGLYGLYRVVRGIIKFGQD